jgi:hypothetical protein
MAIQAWLMDLLCDDGVGDNENYSDLDGDSLNDANQLVGLGSAQVGHSEVEQDRNDEPSGFPPGQHRLGLGAVPDSEIVDNVDSLDNMDCCLDGCDNDLDLYVSTSMDFEEECILVQTRNE